MRNEEPRYRASETSEAEHGPNTTAVAIVFVFMAVLAAALELGFFNV